MIEPITENIYWVGVIDWNIRDFHGYKTRRGTTYNAYLILDEKTTLVDTVKSKFSDGLLANICKITSLEKINYIIINHVEMDHSSSLPKIAKQAKNATIITSKKGKEAIIKHYGDTFNIKTVKTGDKLSLGKRTIQFLEAPMLHWPDSMFTYLVEDKILMPNDAFGQHLATTQRFDDQVNQHVLMEEAATYYANILTPFAPLITRKIQQIKQLGIAPEVIAPSHGVIWRSNPTKIVKAYLDWSEGKTKNKVVIVYDTMWQSTDKMARAILEGIASEGVDVRLLKLRSAELTEVVTEVLEAKAVVVGSPTLNNQMFHTISAFLTHITGLNPRGKKWFFFGSFGWGGGAVKSMVEATRKAGFAVQEPTLEINYVPDKEEIKKCFEFGKKIAAEIRG